MITDRNKSNFITTCCWIACLIFAATIVGTVAIEEQHLKLQQHQQQGNLLENDKFPADTTIRAFSPRMDYNNEWRPVGRGDPLKNDPTFDYSPPVLDRVRYWADNNVDKDGKAGKDSKPYAVGNGKKEVLMLGSPSSSTTGSLTSSTKGSDPYRGSATLSSYQMKYAKGDVPVLQPKYTSIRRSYYAQNLPTHLMPPPMQSSADGQSSHVMKSVMPDYRSHMMSEYGPMSSTMGSGHHAYSKPYYSTAVTSMHSSPHNVHRLPMSPSPREAVHSEYVNYVNRVNTVAPESYVSRPNSIGHGAGMVRKPWLHELLQKELIKPTHPSVKHKIMPNYGSKPMHQPASPYEFVMPSHAVTMVGISTTHTPPTMYTSSLATQSTTTQSTASPVYITSTTPYTPTRSTTTEMPSTTSTRFLIPETSNLAYRPTVASLEMTTDSLFKHYKQPHKPLMGPMYLIIEGHSKVKSYGKNEIDPHQPKIVPIIPKREPVVRIADPNERRGTVETFQVKHLHTKLEATDSPKPTKSMVSFKTSKPEMSTTARPKTTTTSKPKPTVKPTEKKPQPVEPIPNLPTSMDSIFSFLDNSLGDIFKDDSTNINKSPTIYVTSTSSTILRPVTTSTTVKPKQIEARIGTHSLLIEAEDEEEVTTEPAPRETRQVFDYDQLPESRLKDLDAAGTENEQVYDDEDSEDAEFDWNENDYADDTHKLIKRIDDFAGDSEEDQFDVLDLEDEETELFEDEDGRATT